MVQQQPRQLSAGVSRHSHNRCLHCLRHDSSIFLSRVSTSLRALHIRADHQHRVVAGNGAHHLGPAFAIQRRGHRLRSTHHRPHDHLVHRLAHAQAEALHHLRHRRWPIIVACVPRRSHSRFHWEGNSRPGPLDSRNS